MDFKSKVILSFALNAFLLTCPTYVRADVSMVSNSAELKRVEVEYDFDERVNKLSAFLKDKKSPLTNHARQFVSEADKNGLDWRLVPSISGVESSFGKRIPFNSYNAYGWANGDFKFESWDESINIVSETLNKKYYKKGATDINKIARRYAPPSSTWAGNVKYFMNKIDPVPVQFDLQ